MGDSDEEFSFDDEPQAWADDDSSEVGFDFDAPAFESESPVESRQETGGEDLQFGEINFGSDSEQDASSYQTEDDFAEGDSPWAGSSRGTATPDISRSQESFEQESPGQKPLPVPASRRKSPLSRILLLLILLLLVLGVAAGYFYLQDGGLNIQRIVQRFTGETQPEVPEQNIGINITSSSYVNNPKVGQLLVIQGKAVNNFPTARSAITVKGILLNAEGQALYQQTVFCGNFLDNQTISEMAFEKIEEAMNNQFGDSLSNMNVATRASIPFTIVFRNLPENIASINVEVVGSKSGSN